MDAQAAMCTRATLERLAAFPAMFTRLSKTEKRRKKPLEKCSKIISSRTRFSISLDSSKLVDSLEHARAQIVKNLIEPSAVLLYAY